MARVSKRVTELEKLATKHVGDGKSYLLFVTDDEGNVCAVFVGRHLRDAARDLADSFREPYRVEDKDGVYYENRAAAKESGSEF